MRRILLSRARARKPAGPLDRPRERAEEAKALLEVPDARAREGVPLQRVRLKAGMDACQADK